MDFIQFSIKSPAKVAVGVLFIILFGLIEFFRIPIQLTPDMDKPNITVSTIWPGASPTEIEKEIVDRQEEELKTLEGLMRMSSLSQRNIGTVNLKFPVGTDLSTAIVRVSNKLDQVKGYPELADRPIITTVDQRAGAVAWFTLKPLPGNNRPIYTYRHTCEDIIKPAFERVKGVGSSNIYGGREKQLVITFDPHTLASQNISIQDFIAALKSTNRNISAGDLKEGKRRYLIRTLGEFTKAEDVENIVIAQQDNHTILLKDIAQVQFDYDEPDVTVRHFGSPSIAMNCLRSSGSNVLEVMKGLQVAMDKLNKEVLADMGLYLTQVYDETGYIHYALDLVQNNIWVGGSLAIFILLLFLRSFSSVLVVAIAIPISIVGTFLIMSLMGRNINLISLAGISFAVGMVVDNSIVVLENIYRHRQMGENSTEASLNGAREVWGAVLASTLTTMAVFLPVLFMKEEIGQLYRDIALAVSASVFISLVISVTAIPAMTSRWMSTRKEKQDKRTFIDSFAKAISRLIHFLLGSFLSRIIVIMLLLGGSLFLSYQLMPAPDYLPKGNRNLVIGMLFPPPGNNLEELTRMGQIIETEMTPHFEYIGNDKQESPKEPVIKNFFFVTSGQEVFMGAIARNGERAVELLPFMKAAASKVPGMFPFVTQVGLFQSDGTQGRSIKLELTGPRLEELLAKSYRIFGMLQQLFPEGQTKFPDLNLGHPEVTIHPNRDLLSRTGLSTHELGVAVDVMMDGRKVSEVKMAGREIDLILKGEEAYSQKAQQLSKFPLIGRGAGLFNLESVADVIIGTGPDKIPHVEQNRVVTIEMEPPANIALDEAMEMIDQNLVKVLQKENVLNENYRLLLSGSAQDLTLAKESLKWKIVLALAITFLLMAGLFENFAYPLVIMVSVPLAAVGGFAGIRIVQIFVPGQNMDTLTMLGFVILTGTVVNNAILIVHQALNHMKEDGQGARESIVESVRSRVRPIFMSTLTSIFGMLPLVLFPGPGSELYRGLGSVVVGGLLISTIFTIFLIPCLFSLVLDLQISLRSMFKREVA
ncbi:MAG: efflux RND transporter permease subunit [Planctomycetes bacterium]|nr:efflux RND transporter permease subunit [Planctomycetota bacterium]